MKEISRGVKIPNMETIMDEDDQEPDADDEPKQSPEKAETTSKQVYSVSRMWKGVYNSA